MTINNAYQNSISCTSRLATEVRFSFTTHGTSLVGLCKLGIFGKPCLDLLAIIEDTYANQGETTVFNLLTDTTKSIKLPTLMITPIECVVTTWTVHLQSDDSNMVSAYPTVFAITDPDLTLTHSISDFTQRNSLFGLSTYYLVGSTNTIPPTISSRFDFVIDFQDACRTSAITAITLTLLQAKFGTSGAQSLAPFNDSIDDAGQHTRGICGEKIVTLAADTPIFLSLTSDVADPISNDLTLAFLSSSAVEADIKSHTISYTVSSKEYPTLVAQITDSFTFEIICPDQVITEQSAWIQPAKWTTTEFGETKSIVAPVLSICKDDAHQNPVQAYEFTSVDKIAGGNIDWVTFDQATNTFNLEPSEQEYKDYHGKTITIAFEAYDASDATRLRLTDTKFKFEIEFDSVVLNVCSTSTLQAQGSTPQQVVSFFRNPQPFLLPLFTNTGTVALQQIVGHETDTCGDLLYTPAGDLSSWVIQDSTDPRLFSFDLSQDYHLVGDHKLKVTVSSNAKYTLIIQTHPLEIDITVENPCLDTSVRKFVEVLNATDIIVPIGSNSTAVNITWFDEIDFNNITNLTEACGPFKVKVIYPQILVATELEKDEPQNGVMLSLPSLEDKPKFTKEDLKTPLLLTVKAYYTNYETETMTDIIYQNIIFQACNCNDGLIVETYNKTVLVSQNEVLRHTFEAPKCSLEADGCEFNWVYELGVRGENQILDGGMFILNQETGEFQIKAELMPHYVEVMHQFDLIIFNNVTRSQSQNFTIQINILEEKLVASGFVYKPDLKPEGDDDEEKVKVDLLKFQKTNKNTTELEPKREEKPKHMLESKQQPITASFSSIDLIGTITIEFNPPEVFVPINWQEIFVQEHRTNLTLEEQYDYEEFSSEALKVEFIKLSEEIDQEFFKYKLVSFEPGSIQISLNFSQPLLVSQGEIPDRVKINLAKSVFLNRQALDSYRKLAGKETKLEVIFDEELPQLLASAEEAKQLKDQAQQADDLIAGQFLASFFLQFFLSGALSMLWNVFNTLQLIVALELLNLIMPANVQLIYDMIKDTINFQVVPKDFLYDNIIANNFGLPDYSEQATKSQSTLTIPDPENEQVEETKLGQTFGTVTTLANVLLILLAVIFLFALIALVLLCRTVLLRRCNRKVIGIVRAIESKLMFNAVFRSLLESYLQIVIIMWYGWRNRRVNDTLESRIDFLLALLITIYCFAFPVLQHRFLAARVDRAGLDASLDSRYGSLYTNVKILSLNSIGFTMVFLTRRLAFAYTICHMDRSITIQVMVIDTLSTFILAYYISVRPMKDAINNFIQIFNEVIVLLCTWLLFLFTDYVPDPVLRYKYGRNYTYLIGFNFAVNLLVLVWVMVWQLIQACRKKYVKHRQAKKSAQQIEPESSEESSSLSQSESDSDDGELPGKTWDQRAKEYFAQLAFDQKIKAINEADNLNTQDLYMAFKQRQNEEGGRAYLTQDKPRTQDKPHTQENIPLRQNAPLMQPKKEPVTPRFTYLNTDDLAFMGEIEGEQQRSSDARTAQQESSDKVKIVHETRNQPQMLLKVREEKASKYDRSKLIIEARNHQRTNEQTLIQTQQERWHQQSELLEESQKPQASEPLQIIEEIPIDRSGQVAQSQQFSQKLAVQEESKNNLGPGSVVDRLRNAEKKVLRQLEKKRSNSPAKRPPQRQGRRSSPKRPQNVEQRSPSIMEIKQKQAISESELLLNEAESKVERFFRWINKK